MGNYLVKEIQKNMQLKLYNAREMTNLLSEPEKCCWQKKRIK